MYMIRKQLYLGEEQERELKRRARSLGLSEAELVRQALDALLALEGTRPAAGGVPGSGDAVDEVIRRAGDLVRRGHRLPPGERLDRASLYDEREGRWGGLGPCPE
jgi:hypothetical protein